MLYVVQIREKSRREFPATWIINAPPGEASNLEHEIRMAFEQGRIKDFLFQPVEDMAANPRDVWNHLNALRRPGHRS